MFTLIITRSYNSIWPFIRVSHISCIAKTDLIFPSSVIWKFNCWLQAGVGAQFKKNWILVYIWMAIMTATNTAKNMQVYGFSMTYILPYIVDSALKRKNTGKWKLVFLHILCKIKNSNFVEK